MGEWLRRMGRGGGLEGLEKVNTGYSIKQAPPIAAEHFAKTGYIFLPNCE